MTNLISFSFLDTKLLTESRQAIMVTGGISAVIGIAASFFTQNTFAVIGYTLLGITSTLGFWAARTVKVYDEVNKNLADATQETAELQQLSQELKKEIEESRDEIAQLNTLKEEFKKDTEHFSKIAEEFPKLNSDLLEQLKQVKETTDKLVKEKANQQPKRFLSRIL